MYFCWLTNHPISLLILFFFYRQNKLAIDNPSLFCCPQIPQRWTARVSYFLFIQYLRREKQRERKNREKSSFIFLSSNWYLFFFLSFLPVCPSNKIFSVWKDWTASNRPTNQTHDPTSDTCIITHYPIFILLHRSSPFSKRLWSIIACLIDLEHYMDR